ncbi:MAG: SDR family oxidoreductase [Pirellulales bacterium]|nr:SDR family oxidoreductase [Pirellulales bacterium]
MMSKSISEQFNLRGRVAVITGGAGLLGVQHASAIAEAGGVPVLADIDGDTAKDRANKISAAFGVQAIGCAVDITSEESVCGLLRHVCELHPRIHVLINNAANNPKMESHTDVEFSRLENFPLGQWEKDLQVGLTGSFICSKFIGNHMAQSGGGAIINIASDLGTIAPDQRLYRKDGVADEDQPVKPVTYSVVKAGLIGLTKYLSTYWPEKGVRANSFSPGGVFNGQSPEFVEKLGQLIPMGRMAAIDEYRAAIVFLSSDASSYMNGSDLAMDGGRTAW